MSIEKNYTRPDDENYEDKPEDWLFLTMIFGRALTKFLAHGQGILIDVKGDMIELHPDAKRVIIFNDGKQLRVINATERTDLQDGDLIQMIAEDNIIN